jgi:hypothetical protein
MSPGQVYRENQYVSNVSYRLDVREEAGELIRIGGYIQIVGGVKDKFGYGDECLRTKAQRSKSRMLPKRDIYETNNQR